MKANRKSLIPKSLFSTTMVALACVAVTSTSPPLRAAGPANQAGFHPGNENSDARRITYTLDGNASGLIETVNHIVNLTVVSKDPADLRAEYRAGFIQGKLQGHTIWSARDNSWDNAYLTDPSHGFPKQRGPTQAELENAGAILNGNYGSFLDYLRNPASDAGVVHKLQRLLFRLLGIYHGATLAHPEELDFSGSWLPDFDYLNPAELALGTKPPRSPLWVFTISMPFVT